MSTALQRKPVTSSLCLVTMLTITSSEYSNDRHLIYSLHNIAKEVKFVYYSLELQIIVLPVQFKSIRSSPDNNHTLWPLTADWPPLSILRCWEPVVDSPHPRPFQTTHVRLILYLFIYIKTSCRFIKHLSTSIGGRPPPHAVTTIHKPTASRYIWFACAYCWLCNINMHVPCLLSRFVMSGLLLGIVLSVRTCWFHNKVTLPSWLVSNDFVTVFVV